MQSRGQKTTAELEKQAEKDRIMENCELKYDNRYRTFTTKNVTVSALVAIFGINPSWSCWLKDMTDTYIFPDDQGTFPTLESFGMYDVEVCHGNTSKPAKRSRQSSDESSDSDFNSPLCTAAYKLATDQGRKSKGKGKGPLPKTGTRGKRAVPTSSSGTLESWFFKITIGEWKAKKIAPIKNCLIQCDVRTTCTAVKEELARELKITDQTKILLYDSDYLEVTDSNGRVGRYWSGTRKIFGVLQTVQDVPGPSTSAPELTTGALVSIDEINNALEPLNNTLNSINKKIDNTQFFLMKGHDTVFKEISLFVQEIFKCPICVETTKDDFPHATSCCNHVFCLACINELVIRKDDTCPLCKQKRGPPYPILLSCINELVSKIHVIPFNDYDNHDPQDNCNE